MAGVVDRLIVMFIPRNLDPPAEHHPTMLKIAPFVIGLLTVVSMTSNAQAMPREIYSPSGQPAIIQVTPEVFANEQEESAYYDQADAENYAPEYDDQAEVEIGFSLQSGRSEGRHHYQSRYHRNHSQVIESQNRDYREYDRSRENRVRRHR
jgi:hypothetical protein